VINSIVCSQCKASYNIDMEKYSGKKIKCKSCSNIISIPVFNQSSDGFEVVAETAPTQVVVRHPTPSQQSTSPGLLNRNRASGIRGAVNIALLQRNEPSRESIRNNFLDINGTENDRIPDSVISFIKSNREIDAQIQKLNLDKLPWLKDVLARAIATNSDDHIGENLTTPESIMAQLFTNSGKLGKSNDEDAYSLSLGILGGPIRPIPPAVVAKTWRDSFNITSLESQRKSYIRQIKIDTIKAAIDVSETTFKMLLSEKENNDLEYNNIISQHSRLSKQTLISASNSMASGDLMSATNALQNLVKTAPLDIIGQVLVALSQSTYLNGNAANSARHMQDAICFGASAPVNMDDGYNDLWAKASAGLPNC
jgi:predicted Zn finger-like uncharacterized protein